MLVLMYKQITIISLKQLVIPIITILENAKKHVMAKPTKLADLQSYNRF